MSAAILSGFLAVSFGLSLVWRMRDARRSNAHRARLGDGSAPQVVPDTLIPRIDKELCIGSGTCVAACPEHNVIGIVDGVAKLITPSACVGHGECAAACPVGAIKLVFGTREHPVQLPAFDRDLQTNLPGVYIAGEVSGISLIRNAIKLGKRAADAIAASGRRGGGGMKDALVIGAGPAGVSAALELRQHGLSVEVLERSAAPLATLRAYPAQKRVQLGKVELAGGARIRAAALDKEELLEKLIAVTERSGLAIRANEAALAIEPRAGGWTVRTARGTHGAANVVVALGRRGAARRLDVPGRRSAEGALRAGRSERGARPRRAGGRRRQQRDREPVRAARSGSGRVRDAIVSARAADPAARGQQRALRPRARARSRARAPEQRGRARGERQRSPALGVGPRNASAEPARRRAARRALAGRGAAPLRHRGRRKAG